MLVPTWWRPGGVRFARMLASNSQTLCKDVDVPYKVQHGLPNKQDPRASVLVSDLDARRGIAFMNCRILKKSLACLWLSTSRYESVLRTDFQISTGLGSRPPTPTEVPLSRSAVSTLHSLADDSRQPKGKLLSTDTTVALRRRLPRMR